ncbi:MAG TPA: NADPH-dependent FMN reductase [Steroidobacteraceae bacterium]|nr:NADPH-dependent FMN reductase [Steroidobacteraceae bacterium]
MNFEDRTTRAARVLCLAGSLRRDSWNRRLLKSAASTRSGSELVLYEGLAAIPFFNEDDEGAVAQGVRELGDAVSRADALLIATPEYNHSFPAVLKNAIDWLSRGSKSALTGKPIAVIGASSGNWGTRLAQTALRQVLTATGALVMPAPMLFVARVSECFDADGNLVDPKIRESLNSVLRALEDWIELHRGRSEQL